MDYNFNITKKERDYLRDLARKQLEYANLPVMEKRKKLWYAHNSLKGERPIIVMEMETFEEDLLPRPECQSVAAQEIEKNLQRRIINHEFIDDDKVVSPYYTVNWKIILKEFGVLFKRIYSRDGHGKSIGYTEKYPIKNLKKDMSLLKPSTFIVDRDYTLAWKAFIEDIIGDILPVRIKNDSLRWHVAPSQKAFHLMGLETLMLSMIDYPKEIHKLYNFLSEDIYSFVKWQEQENLLTLNNENDFTGAGSYGFTDELPVDNRKVSSNISPKDLWGNMNSQESVVVSPKMYGEFIFPYYYKLASKFGLVYYGCCEPVHDIWDKYISYLPGLRKVSISPWCDEKFMGEALKGSNVIYSRKPSPNFVGVGSFDKEEFARHIKKTLNAATGCSLELIFRDIYTLSGDKSKPGNAVKITRRLIDEMW